MTSEKKIDIPENMVEQLQEFLETLNVKKSTLKPSEKGTKDTIKVKFNFVSQFGKCFGLS